MVRGRSGLQFRPRMLMDVARGPLVFCLLLSMFLSMGASTAQGDLIFSGVFSIVWIGEAVVTAQIKLLGGNM
jgi:protein YIPF6